MTFIVASDRQDQVQCFTKDLHTLFPDSVIQEYGDPRQVLDGIGRQPVDAVFLEARTEHMDGMKLLRELSVRYPMLAVHVLADSDDYLDDALWDGASGYLVRPISLEELWEALEDPD